MITFKILTKQVNLKAVKRNDILGTDLYKNSVAIMWPEFENFIKREIACHIVIEIAIIGYCLFISVQSVAQNISNAWLLVFTMLYICQWIGFLANAASINELGYHYTSLKLTDGRSRCLKLFYSKMKTNLSLR